MSATRIVSVQSTLPEDLEPISKKIFGVSFSEDVDNEDHLVDGDIKSICFCGSTNPLTIAFSFKVPVCATHIAVYQGNSDQIASRIVDVTVSSLPECLDCTTRYGIAGKNGFALIPLKTVTGKPFIASIQATFYPLEEGTQKFLQIIPLRRRIAVPIIQELTGFDQQKAMASIFPFTAPLKGLKTKQADPDLILRIPMVNEDGVKTGATLRVPAHSFVICTRCVKLVDRIADARVAMKGPGVIEIDVPEMSLLTGDLIDFWLLMFLLYTGEARCFYNHVLKASSVKGVPKTLIDIAKREMAGCSGESAPSGESVASPDAVSELCVKLSDEFPTSPLSPLVGGRMLRGQPMEEAEKAAASPKIDSKSEEEDEEEEPEEGEKEPTKKKDKLIYSSGVKITEGLVNFTFDLLDLSRTIGCSAWIMVAEDIIEIFSSVIPRRVVQRCQNLLGRSTLKQLAAVLLGTEVISKPEFISSLKKELLEELVLSAVSGGDEDPKASGPPSTDAPKAAYKSGDVVQLQQAVNDDGEVEDVPVFGWQGHTVGDSGIVSHVLDVSKGDLKKCLEPFKMSVGCIEAVSDSDIPPSQPFIYLIDFGQDNLFVSFASTLVSGSADSMTTWNVLVAEAEGNIEEGAEEADSASLLRLKEWGSDEMAKPVERPKNKKKKTAPTSAPAPTITDDDDYSDYDY
ncbi:hypothetical protein ADUPG1_013436 [Aduncisulcus paluster]|uniref:Uncharacterized protein n=1 Tax=Aduncisulcus paluster TaxID=2918883 RepID=A0ABQ5K719_9EUKA|nr:hypothetical protein ADUPG1_013436 [Aduncisulcus paluster]|eukprot:gnl/Carplike_NY0171/1348_a1832_1446.p1 GENE.gnl/Carplike_NY0171/1348_a1832_1446~~gnl/Carplike_NY0171/1348_a1832_1446.p1  ORF type:complete len:684 (+),score=285.83 gnl/Carplike_NY0171/1348_a1832_1446:61-2112(+)